MAGLESIDIATLIHRGGILYDVEGATPQEVYAKVSKMIDLPEDMTSDQVYTALCEREKVLSTAVGNGIALPHASVPIMKDEADQRICVVYLKEPLSMGAPDDKPVTTMFVLLTYDRKIHLQVLSSLAGLFRDARFREALNNKADEAVLSALIKELA